jgi:GMP synthase-like glutamine amidotransferase
MGSVTPPDQVHMLVFETDDAHPETQDRKGSFGDIFDDLFKRAGDEHSPPLKVTTSIHYVVDDPSNDKHGHVPTVAEIGADVHAILITGSMYDAHGDEPWVRTLVELLRDLWKRRPDIKFSGVCFGHQVLARMLGAKVEGSEGGKWELAHTQMDLTPVGQKLFLTENKSLSLHQMHQDHVTTVPDHESSQGLLKEDTKVHVWASTEHTEIQGLYIRDRLFSSQGHLGFDEKMVHRQIEMREESGGIKDSEHAAEAKETAHLKHDGVVVAGAIMRFFHGDDHDID